MFLKNTQNSQGSTYARVSNSAVLGRILYNSSFSTSMLAGCQICQQELSKFTNIVANLLQTAMSLPRLFNHCHSLSQNQYLRLIIFLHRYLLLNKPFCIFLDILPDLTWSWTLSWRRFILYRNQFIETSKLMDCFLYDRNLHRKRDNMFSDNFSFLLSKRNFLKLVCRNPLFP